VARPVCPVKLRSGRPLGVAGERFVLEAADVLAFPGNLPHAYQNLNARADAQGVSVVIFAKAR
jgi:hypothetical protein